MGVFGNTFGNTLGGQQGALLNIIIQPTETLSELQSRITGHSNTIFWIANVHVLNGTLNVGDNILKFSGGSFSNGILNFSGGKVSVPNNYKCFDSIRFNGTLNQNAVFDDWFVDGTDLAGDVTNQLQCALSMAESCNNALYLGDHTYNVSACLPLKNGMSLIGDSSILNVQDYIYNTTMRRYATSITSTAITFAPSPLAQYITLADYGVSVGDTVRLSFVATDIPSGIRVKAAINYKNASNVTVGTLGGNFVEKNGFTTIDWNVVAGATKIMFFCKTESVISSDYLFAWSNIQRLNVTKGTNLNLVEPVKNSIVDLQYGINSVISGVTIEGNNVARTQTAYENGIYVNESDNFRLENLTVNETSGYGINILNSLPESISNIEINDCGVFGSAGTGDGCVGLRVQLAELNTIPIPVSNVSVFGSGRDGISIRGGRFAFSNIEGSGNGIDMVTTSPGAAGLYLVASACNIEDVTFVNCKFSNNTGIGLDIATDQAAQYFGNESKNITIQDSEFSLNGLCGIGIVAIDGVIVENNQIFNNGQLSSYGDPRLTAFSIGKQYSAQVCNNYLIQNNNIYDDQVVKTQSNFCFASNSGIVTDLKIHNNNFSGLTSSIGQRLNLLIEAVDVSNDNVGFVLSWANTTGILPCLCTELHLISSTTNVTTIRPSLISGNTITVVNDTASSITFVNSTNLLLTGGTNYTLTAGSTIVFENVTAGIWQQL